MYGLADQMRRAAVSIPSNIAEGKGRRTTKDFIHFLYVAQGSLNELATQIKLAKRIEYLTPEDYSAASASISQCVSVLTRCKATFLPPGSRILSSFCTLDPFSTTHNVQPITENGTSSHFLWCHLLTLPFSLLFSDTVTTIPKGFAPVLSGSWLNPRRHLFKWFKIKNRGTENWLLMKKSFGL